MNMQLIKWILSFSNYRSGKPFSTSAMDDYLTGTVIGCTSDSAEEIEDECNQVPDYYSGTEFMSIAPETPK